MEFTVPIQKESQDRYLTYALSVVSDRALPDVRDGLKPVQRRILYAMYENLGLLPEKAPRKSAAVVGEVLARYHPHGDIACYEAMVRMAQYFSLRYPLIEGQGNFGSLDGDSAAAYRYTEAKLRPIAIDVLGEIDEETVFYKDNFDATTKEPEVLPSKIPNLLVNGASGIAVGMATNIPPHNLKDVIKALLGLLDDPEISLSRLTGLIKGPDFPTGCVILNTKKELEDIYRTGRGAIRMRGEWRLEEGLRKKKYIIVTSIPFVVNKAQLVEKIASLIIDRKVPQLVDVRDESTEDVRVVIELATDADADAAMAYLFKNTPLESSFAINLTALVPTDDEVLVPRLLSLRECLQYFLDFRTKVVTKRLQFELRNLNRRIHILEGLVTIFDSIEEALEIVRKSKGRMDSAEKLRKRFILTEEQSFAVVDMRIYQISNTNIEDIRLEWKEKSQRVQEIEHTLATPSAIENLIRADLADMSDKYGERRLCRIDNSSADVELREEDYLVNEEVYALISRDGWIKRLRQTNDYHTTRLREGDEIQYALMASTLDYVVFFTNFGIVYTLRVVDFPSSSGFGTPVQKLLKFRDGEVIVAAYVYADTGDSDLVDSGIGKDGETRDQYLKLDTSLCAVTEQGMGSSFSFTTLVPTKKSGKRFMKVRDEDRIVGVSPLNGQCVVITTLGQALRFNSKDIPQREGVSVGVVVMSLNQQKGDRVCGLVSPANLTGSLAVMLDSGREKEISVKSITLGKRGLRGSKIINSGKLAGVRLVK
jgi:DNA gyrase subunit A